MKEWIVGFLVCEILVVVFWWVLSCLVGGEMIEPFGSVEIVTLTATAVILAASVAVWLLQYLRRCPSFYTLAAARRKASVLGDECPISQISFSGGAENIKVQYADLVFIRSERNYDYSVWLDEDAWPIDFRKELKQFLRDLDEAYLRYKKREAMRQAFPGAFEEDYD